MSCKNIRIKYFIKITDQNVTNFLKTYDLKIKKGYFKIGAAGSLTTNGLTPCVKLQSV
jgi:hypothetical protein